jgi:hypothetical protein
MPCFQPVFCMLTRIEQHCRCNAPQNIKYTKDVSLAISMTAVLPIEPNHPPCLVAWQLGSASRH